MFFVVIVYWCNQGDVVGQFQGGFKVFCQVLFQFWFDFEVVNYDINLVFVFFVQSWDVVDVVDGVIDL